LLYVPTGIHFEKADQRVYVCVLEAEGLGALFVHLSQRECEFWRATQ